MREIQFSGNKKIWKNWKLVVLIFLFHDVPAVGSSIFFMRLTMTSEPWYLYVKKYRPSSGTWKALLLWKWPPIFTSMLLNVTTVSCDTGPRFDVRTAVNEIEPAVWIADISAEIKWIIADLNLWSHSKIGFYWLDLHQCYLPVKPPPPPLPHMNIMILYQRQGFGTGGEKLCLFAIAAARCECVLYKYITNYPFILKVYIVPNEEELQRCWWPFRHPRWPPAAILIQSKLIFGHRIKAVAILWMWSKVIFGHPKWPAAARKK